MELNPGLSFVSREVFCHCRELIRPLLDNSALLPYLQKYDMLSDAEDVDKLTSPYYQMEDRFTSLVNLIERQGECGYMLLYMCIRESCAEAPSHADARTHLDTMGAYFFKL